MYLLYNRHLLSICMHMFYIDMLYNTYTYKYVCVMLLCYITSLSHTRTYICLCVI